MKYDVLIAGGGLSGLTAGIRLQKEGMKCAIVSSGQNAMHFSSGSFDILNRMPDGRMVSGPASEIDNLPAYHPYRIIGKDNTVRLFNEIKPFFAGCGIGLTGSVEKNSYRLTPTGDFRPTGLALDDFVLLETKNGSSSRKVMIVNIFGYLDFNTKFIADALERNGMECGICSVRLEEIERLRKNPSEMRSTNISRVLDDDGICGKFADEVNKLLKDEECVVLPAVFGLKNPGIVDVLRDKVKAKVHFVATMPPSVPGIRTQMRLKHVFEEAGGRMFNGDTIVSAKCSGHRVESVFTGNFGDMELKADNYILATGSFFSKGLVSTPDSIYEPLFGIDLLCGESRAEWNNLQFFSKQNYIGYGASVTGNLQALKNGEAFDNLYVIGSVLGGANTLYEGCGAGVAIVTAMRVAEIIAEKQGE